MSSLGFQFKNIKENIFHFSSKKEKKKKDAASAIYFNFIATSFLWPFLFVPFPCPHPVDYALAFVCFIFTFCWTLFPFQWWKMRFSWLGCYEKVQGFQPTSNYLPTLLIIFFFTSLPLFFTSWVVFLCLPNGLFRIYLRISLIIL